MSEKIELLAEHNPDAIVFEAPSYEDALVGVTSCCQLTATRRRSI